ncbi:MAG: FkbM family methyltransferase [Cyanobacteria bacterium]|nr:FkbM family methyltransferase [Cyanobacteriota bacterium]MDW8201932.1 FkbM family methyltransferase [Cyanobacteriota bacterium SKYGB_h_bin112]
MKNYIAHLLKLGVSQTYRKNYYAMRQKCLQHLSVVRQLQELPRYTSASITLLGETLDIVDSASCLSMYQDIFEREIYKFTAKGTQPFVIDCGSNIGMSVIYIKRLYPESSVLAFESDPNVVSVLEKNIRSFKLSSVEIIPKAVWNAETTLEFLIEGADGGRLIDDQSDQSDSKLIQVKTVRLRDYLDRPISFLKIDIEGAETCVIEDCKDLLSNVENIFVEYHSFVGKPQTLHVLLGCLIDAGFRVHLHANAPIAQPFIQRAIHTEMDMQLNIFGFRE